MAEASDLLEFFEHARRNWRIPSTIVAFAVACAAVISLALPNRFTATATILIEPPGASDPRISTAVSPIYLESLKTYETFAASDTLFKRACEKYHLVDAASPAPIETLKRRVLSVKKPKDTKLLDISVTLREPRRAQAVAQYLAEQTVALSAQVSENHDREMLARARTELEQATRILQEARSMAARAESGAAAAREAEVDALSRAVASVLEQSAEAEANASEASARQSEAARAKSPEADTLRQAAAAAHVRAETLKNNAYAVSAKLAAKGEQLTKARRQEAEADDRIRSAEAAYDRQLRRVADLEAGIGLRSEQLRIVDPGIVPERPSSPNMAVNCLAAFVSSLVAAVTLLFITFNAQRQRSAFGRPSLQVARRGSA